jgi:hypothetical protein
MPQFRYGGYDFTFSGAYSGYGPKEIRGPDRTSFVVEHQIPAREGGVIEYLGSQQSTYQWKGFIVQSENSSGIAALVLSGNSYIAVNADDAKDFIKAMRGSGVQLMLIESTYSNGSGYQNFYEQGFFQIEKVTLALEAGRSYPYYPYGIDFRGVTPTVHGNTSASVSLTTPISGNYFSGYITVIFMNSGYALSETLNTLGFFAQTIASGNAKMAFYASNDLLLAQTAPTAIHSGWNYLPIRPSTSGLSGDVARIAIKSDSSSISGWTLATVDTTNTIIAFNGEVSGQAYTAAWPASLSGQYIGKSGFAHVLVAVAGA